MDLITLAMAKPKVIDLDSYGIGTIVMGLAMSGGGSTVIEDTVQFWNELTPNREMRMTFAFGNQAFKLTPNAISFEANMVVVIAFDIPMVLSGDSITTISVVIGNHNGGANIFVRLT